MRDEAPQYRILVTTDMTWSPEALEVLRPLGRVDYLHPAGRRQVLMRIGAYDAWLGQTDLRVDEEMLSQARRLRVLCTCSTGTDHIDKAALRQRGIDLISITTEYELLETFTSTAELAWALLLACRRKLPRLIERAGRGELGIEPEAAPPPQLSGKTLGVLGFGRLGCMVAEYGRAFRMRVLACDVKPFSAEGVGRVDFDTLIRESDVLSLHVHLTDQTRHIISREVLARMKRGAILINTARGDLIDESALIEVLASGRLAGAGLDVVHDEWDPDLANHPILDYARTHDNLIVTPHVGGGSLESVADARIFTARKLAEYLRNLNPSPRAGADESNRAARKEETST